MKNETNTKHPPFITDKHPPLSWSDLQKIQNFIKENTYTDENKQLLIKLAEAHPHISIEHKTSEQIYWRVRPSQENGQHYDCVSQLLWPPPQKVNAGRANDPNQPLLYISDRRDTALSELFDKTQDNIDAHFIGIKILPNKTAQIGIIGEIFHIYRTGKGLLSSKEQYTTFNNMINACPLDDARRLIISDAIIFDIFSNSKNYEITALIANTIHQKAIGIDGFYYSSTKQYGGLNIALRPESYLKNWGIASIFHTPRCKLISHGMWDIGKRTHVTGIYNSGKLNFSEESSEEKSYHLLSPLFINGA